MKFGADIDGHLVHDNTLIFMIIEIVCGYKSTLNSSSEIDKERVKKEYYVENLC